MSSASADFFKNEKFLVVEPSKVFIATLQSCLHAMGVKADRISLASKYEDAVALIEEQKPKILISEYDITGKSGLALVELHQKTLGEELRVSLIVSQNSSDSVVAEAAEEEVDGFLLKPFSQELFQRKLTSIIETKLKPSEYSIKIATGQAALNAGLYDDAIKAFTDAKQMHPRPSLACYYLGEAYRMQKEISLALQDFRSGRTYQTMHYKCLVGEFEVLVEKKEYSDANGLIPILMQNFPLTPKRMTQIFIAAVFSKNFEYLSMCFEQYLKLEKKSPELTNIASMALFTGGKWFLQQKDFPQAAKLFENSFYTVGRDIQFLEKIIVELSRAGAGREAQYLFQKASSVDVGTDIHSRISFEVDRLTLPREYMFEKSRRYYQLGIASKDQYTYMVKYFADEKKEILAESVAAKAISQFPDMKDSIYGILKTLK